MAARIQTTYDFTANTSNAEAAVKRLAEGVKAGNSVLAQAEKAAKDTYQSQSLAARAAGASTEQLTKIQQAYFQSLVAIRNAAKDLGTTLVSANTNATTSEDAKTEAIRLATTAIEAQTAAVKANAAAQASAHSISNQTAASGAVQFLEGRNGIRTVENFLGNSLGLGGLFGVMFPVIGAAQTGKLLYDIGEKVYDVGSKASQAGKLLSDAFAESHAKALVTIDDLIVQADKIQLSIDKLEGHPGNGLKLALDEARVYADKLQASLLGDRKELEALLKEHQVGAFGSILSGVEGTGKQQKEILSDHDAVSKQIAAANIQFNADSANAKSLDDIKAAGKKRDNAIRAAIQGTIDTYKTETKRLQQQQDDSAKLVSDSARSGSHANQFVNNTAKIADIQVAQGRYQDFLNTFNAQGNVADLTEREGALKGQKEQDALAKQGNTKAAEAARKALELQRQQDAALGKAWEESHAQWQAEADRNSDDEAQFWIGAMATMRVGSDQYIAAQEKIAEAIRATRKNTLSLNKDNDKLLRGLGDDNDTRSLKEGQDGIQAQAKATADLINALAALAAAQAANRQELAQANIQYGLANGSLSKYDAAVLTQTLHTTQYQAALAKLQDQLAHVTGDGADAAAKRTGLQTQITQLDSQRVLQVMQDETIVAANTIGGALRNVNSQWISDTKDTAKEIAGLYSSTVNGLNGNLTDVLSRVGERGQHHLGRRLGNAVGGTLRSGAGQLANYGLRSAESSVLGAFGLGAGKPDGSQSKPYYVMLAGSGMNGAAGLLGAFGGGQAFSSVFGSLFGPKMPSSDAVSSLAGNASPWTSLIGLFGGGKAVGGPVSAGTTYLVGENGPELFNPGASGNITPNNKLKGMMGTTYLHMPVDARGSNDPAATEAAVNRGIARATPQIVAASLKAHSDQQSRRPYSQRN